MSTIEPTPYPKNSKELLEKWLKRLRESQFAHYEAAKSLSQSNYTLGIPAVILSTLVGTSIFASLGETPISSVQILVGITSVLAATLSAVQTFLGLSERASKHRAVAARYGSTRRRIEQLLALSAESITPEEISALRLEIDGIAEEAPNVSDKVWNRIEQKLGE
jgi:hypothetical protein